jgi:hypothetical protein
MLAKELMEKLFGEATPYPGMDVQWECFAGAGAIESGTYKGKIIEITWCSHCGLPTFSAETEHGGQFEIRFSETQNRWVCGQDAPE